MYMYVYIYICIYIKSYNGLPNLVKRNTIFNAIRTETETIIKDKNDI